MTTPEQLETLRLAMEAAKEVHAKAIRKALRNHLSPPVTEYKAHLAAYRAYFNAVDGKGGA